MPWVEVFAVFLTSHLTGDYLIQTQWQASHKHGGLGSDPEARRALLAHIATYSLMFVPALIWLADDLGGGVFAVLAVISGLHLVQDDGRLLASYVRTVKRAPAEPGPLLMAVDQSFHVLTLFLIAIVAGN